MSALRGHPLGSPLLLLSPAHPRRLAPLAPLRGPEGCPLCPGGAAGEGHRLARVGGSFATPMGRPALRVEAPEGLEAEAGGWEAEGLGAHEVLVLDVAHGQSPAALDARAWQDFITVAVARARDLRGDRRLGPITLSLGWRAEAGARVDHLHGQLHAWPRGVPWPAPPDPEPMARALEPGPRRVLRCGPVAAACPLAPRSPMELILGPVSGQGALEQARAPLREALAEALTEALARLRAALGERPLAMGVVLGPSGPWCLRLRPWLHGPSTLSQALDLDQHAIPPERAAEALRAASV